MGGSEVTAGVNIARLLFEIISLGRKKSTAKVNLELNNLTEGNTLEYEDHEHAGKMNIGNDRECAPKKMLKPG